MDYLICNILCIILLNVQNKEVNLLISTTKYIELSKSYSILISSTLMNTRIANPKMLQSMRQKTLTRSSFIDDEFGHLINKKCPGKLYRLLKQRVKTRAVTQVSAALHYQNARESSAFQRTFYRQKQKYVEKAVRADTVRSQLNKILKINQRPQSPFFQINRQNLFKLKNDSQSISSQRSSARQKVQSHLHPYVKIANNAWKTVSKQFSGKNRYKSMPYVQFEPFGLIQPVDIVY